MRKGHQAHRRRTYARRQHEMHERRLQRQTWQGFELGVVEIDDADLLETFDALRPSGQRVFDLLAPRARWVGEAG